MIRKNCAERRKIQKYSKEKNKYNKKPKNYKR